MEFVAEDAQFRLEGRLLDRSRLLCSLPQTEHSVTLPLQAAQVHAWIKFIENGICASDGLLEYALVVRELLRLPN